jgi:hypothetical protein
MVITGCSTLKRSSFDINERTISSVKFLHEYVLPLNTSFKDTWVGGLSGIDYDFQKNQYYLISDDPSQFNPARFYTAKINISNNRIDTIILTDVAFLKQPNGDTYPKPKAGVPLKADAESIRFNPKINQFIWSNEGERLFRPTDTTIVQPALTFMTPDGKFVDTIPLPKGYFFTKKEDGPRKNALFEGVTFADDFKTLYASLEEPKYEDGPSAAFEFDKALTRILKFDVASKKNTAQYAYNLDAMPVKPSMEHSWNVNGISEILSINKNTLLVIERSWAKGHDDHTYVKLFLVDLKNAENEINNPSFITKKPVPVKKKLLFNFESLNSHIDNIEGVTFGPKLPNGNSTLIFCVDNNFAKAQVQQFFLFEVIP